MQKRTILLSILFSFVMTAPALASDDGLNVYYSFDGQPVNDTFTDNSGNGYGGVIVKDLGEGSIVDGKIGKAFNFPGNGALIASLGSGATLGGDFTIATWMKLNEMPTVGFDVMGNTPNDGTGDRWILKAGAIGWSFHVREDLVSGDVSDFGWGVGTGVWHHLAVRRVGNVYSLFINGSPRAQGSHDVELPNAPIISLGRVGDSTAAQQFNGALDEVRIYGRGLSDAEVAALAKPACSNGVDDDGDTLVDYASAAPGGDPGCFSGQDWSEQFACSDGIDNDGDTAIDFPTDVGCKNANSENEAPMCNDGIDNDGDTLIDTLDPQCPTAAGPSEGSAGQNCGLGFELAFILPPLIWLRGRRRARAA